MTDMSSQKPIERDAESFPNALGRAIAAARVERLITQEELGIRSGLHSTAISRIERGFRNPSLLMLLRISEGLGMRLSELVLKAEHIESLLPPDRDRKDATSG